MGEPTSLYEIIREFKLTRKPARAMFEMRKLFAGVELSGASVLEIGAGAGLAGAWALQQGARRYVALEPEAEGSTGGVQSTILQLREALLPADFDVRPLRFQDYDNQGELFDVILSHNSINHLDEEACQRLRHSKEARSVYRSLLLRLGEMIRPGGKLIISDCSRRNFFGLLRLRNPVARTIEWHKHQTPKFWTELIEPLGFQRESLTWNTHSALRHLAPILSNAMAAYFLTSHFRLLFQRQGPERSDQSGFESIESPR
ncbi:MAG: hypothetical protein J7M14_01835 [Planctomycetes bacterium]|nr:hypothetical protein [Planctomycetota bacterium]